MIIKAKLSDLKVKLSDGYGGCTEVNCDNFWVLHEVDPDQEVEITIKTDDND